MKHPATTKGYLLLALAGLLSAPILASAAVVSAPQPGDIFLAFRALGGTGAPTSYLVNIGVDTTYRNAAAGSNFNVAALGNIAADLVATYGANWNTRADVQWSIFGTRGTGFIANYASLPQSTTTLPSLAFNPQDQTQRSNVSGAINDVLVQPNGYLGREATVNSTVAVLQPNTGDSSSYAQQVGGGATDFGSLSGWSSIEGNFSSGTAATSLDLYRFSGTSSSNTAALLGTFRISDNGTLNFAAVPEPGSAGLALLAGSLVWAGRRRRTDVTA